MEILCVVSQIKLQLLGVSLDPLLELRPWTPLGDSDYRPPGSQSSFMPPPNNPVRSTPLSCSRSRYTVHYSGHDSSSQQVTSRGDVVCGDDVTDDAPVTFADELKNDHGMTSLEAKHQMSLQSMKELLLGSVSSLHSPDLM